MAVDALCCFRFSSTRRNWSDCFQESWCHAPIPTEKQEEEMIMMEPRGLVQVQSNPEVARANQSRVEGWTYLLACKARACIGQARRWLKIANVLVPVKPDSKEAKDQFGTIAPLWSPIVRSMVEKCWICDCLLFEYFELTRALREILGKGAIAILDLGNEFGRGPS